MTGLALGKSVSSAQERLGAGNRRMASVGEFLKGLDTQLLLMKKTDEDLIARLKQAEKDKAEVERRHEIDKVYQEKLKEIKREEQRHLRAAKRVPPTFVHNYELDRLNE